MSKNINSSLQNHFHISYNKNQAPFRTASQDVWNFRTGKCPRPTAEWRAELVLAATQIYAMAKSELYLFMDSSYQAQVMAQSFRWGKAPFTCLIPRFQNHSNAHSFAQSILFCETNEISYEIADMDVHSVLNSAESLAWAEKYSTDRPSQILAMHVWKNFADKGRAVVFPFGMPHIAKSADGWKVIEDEKDYALMQFQADFKYAGVPCFFKWSPELAMGPIKDPVLRSLVMNLRTETVLNGAVLKEMFQNYFPLVGNMNWNGFEKNDTLVKKFHQQIVSKEKRTLTAYAFNYADYLSGLEYSAPRAPVMNVG